MVFMASLKPAAWRVLAILTGTTELEQQGFDGVYGLGVQELADTEAAQVRILRRPTVEEVKRALLQWRPNFVYFSGRHEVSTDNKGFGVVHELELCASDAAPLEHALFEIFGNGVEVHAVYLDAPGLQPQVQVLDRIGIPNIVYWEQKHVIPALHAAQFSHCFFSALRTSTVTVAEACALAQHVLNMQLTTSVDGELAHPVNPQLLCFEEVKLPDNCSVPLPVMEGADFTKGVAAVVPGWADVRLLAPRAELRVLLAGDASLLVEQRLAFLGEALRALLVLEARSLQLRVHHPCERVPAHLPDGASEAMRCKVTTQSGVNLQIILGGPPTVLRNSELTQHALRHTLTADAQSLQFRLPPPGAGVVAPRSSSSVARGLPTVDTMLVGPLWAVMILRAMAQDLSCRGLMSLGIVGVGSAPVTHVTQGDYFRFATMITGTRPEVLSDKERRQWCGGGGRVDGSLLSGGLLAPGGPSGPLVQHNPNLLDTEEEAKQLLQQMVAMGYKCARPPIYSCSEAQFMDDLIAFTQLRRNKRIESKFPDAVLNGQVLDLYRLYREVCRLGGFRMGRLINWKGQVFPKLQNWTKDNKMTGVGNALKRHYANYLYHYELCHPEDLSNKRCPKCGHNQSTATDWVTCSGCKQSSHFSCDSRPDLGPYALFATAGGKVYTCQQCSEAPKQ